MPMTSTTPSMNPYTAAQILRQRFSLGEDGTAMRANDPLELLRLRQEREAELKRNVSIGPQTPGAATELTSLESDLASDPYTGTAAHAKQAATETEFAKAQTAGFENPAAQALYERQIAEKNTPAALEALKAENARRQTQQNFENLQTIRLGGSQPANAASSEPTTMERIQALTHPAGSPAPTLTPRGVAANTAGAASPVAPGTSDAAPEVTAIPSDPSNPVVQRAAYIGGQRTAATPRFKVAINASGQPSLAEAAPIKLSAAGVQSISSLASAYTLTMKARQLLAEIQKDSPPTQSGIMGQLVDIGQAEARRKFYGMGGVENAQVSGVLGAVDPRYPRLTALMEQAKVFASRGMLGGMRNMKWIDQIQDHLAQGHLPPAANIERMDNFLDTAPEIVDDIYRTEYGEAGSSDQISMPTSTPQNMGGTPSMSDFVIER
jgi:hypothetical protein